MASSDPAIAVVERSRTHAFAASFLWLMVGQRTAAEISRVTLVRNEQNYKQWELKAKTFEQSFTDDTPVAGENRYYLRIEQADGNMAWSSPVWVSVKE